MCCFNLRPEGLIASFPKEENRLNALIDIAFSACLASVLFEKLSYALL